MRILVTGGAGFIGSHTVDRLLETGHQVRILDNLQKPVHMHGKPTWVSKEVEFIEGDVRDKSAWEKSLKNIDAIFHFAAYQDYLPDFSTFFHVNSVGTALLFETAVELKMNLEKIIVASSQFVQGEGLYNCSFCEIIKGPIMRPDSKLLLSDWEHHCPNCNKTMTWQWTSENYASPPNAYAMAKYSQEIQAITFGRRYQLPTVALRYSIVQGPRQSFYNAYSGACRIFSLNYYYDKPPVLYEDGLQTRDFININDVVEANLLALNENKMNFEVFNVGGGIPYSVKEFAEIVRKVMQKMKNKNLPSALIPGKYRFGDTRHACSDIRKLKKLGWKPQFTPEKSVEDYINWLYTQENVKDIIDYSDKTMKELNVVRNTIK